MARAIAWALALAAFVACGGVAEATQSVNLAWDASLSTNVTGYAVYYRNAAGGATTRLDVGATTTTTVGGLIDGQRYIFYTTAYDSGGDESAPSNEISFPLNTAPSLTAPGDQIVAELTPLNVSASATDADLPADTLTFSLLSAPAGMTIDPATGAISWTPTEAQGPSVNVISVVVADDGTPAMSATQSFTVTVQEVNSAPLVTTPTNQFMGRTNTLNLSVAASDPDVPSNNLTYSLLAFPAGMTIGAGTGVITWTPMDAQGPSTNTIMVKVTDDGTPPLSTTVSFNVIVFDNHGPVLTVPANPTVDEEATLSVSASAVDADQPGQSLTFSLVNPLRGMSINPTTGAISWLPSELFGPGTQVFTVKVSDNGVPVLSDTKSFTVTINEVNLPPVLAKPTDRQINELDTVEVFLFATDPDVPSNTLTYALLSGPDGVVVNPNTGAVTWTPTESQGPSTNTIKVKVTDNGVPPLSATNSFAVVVNEVNSAPVLNPPPNQTVVAATALNVSATATDPDLPANTLTYGLVSPPAGMTIDPGTGAISWTPSEAQSPATNTIVVTVTDDGVPPLSATNSFSVVVKPPNHAPVLNVPANQTINVLSLLTVTNTATDSDLPAQTLSFALVSAPAGVSLAAVTGVLTWTPTEGQGATTNLIAVSVTDDGTPPLSTTNTFQVIVNRLARLSFLSRVNNTVTLDIVGRANVNYTLEASSDLANWSTVLTTNSSNPDFQLIDNGATGDVKFYRMRQDP